MRQPDSTPTPTETITKDSTLDDLQRRIGEWGDRTFPESTLNSIIAHFNAEAAELNEAATFSPRPQLAEEAADCLLLLLHIAHREGFSLWEAANVKRLVNEARTWETDAGAKGYRKHTEARP